MLKKFISAVLFIAVICSCFSGAVFAKQDYDTGVIDFEDYTGTWNATSNPTDITLPTHSSATFAKSGNTVPNASNGVTNGAPDGSTVNGNSLKVYYQYNSALSSNYSGFQFYLNDALENTFRVKFSLYYKQSLGGEYVYFKDDTNNSRAVYITSGRKVRFFWNDYVEDGSGNDITLELDKWYDFDILYNTNNNGFRAVISDNNGVISDTTAVNAESTALSKLTRIDFRSYATLGHSGNNKNTGVAEYYVDNLCVSSYWKYENSSNNATTSNDVDSFDFTNTSLTNSKLNITGNIGELTTNVNVNTVSDAFKGNSLDFTATTSSNAFLYDITNPVARSFSYSIDFRLNDFNFKDIRIQHMYAPSNARLPGGDATFQVTSAKGVNMLGQRVKVNGGTTGANYEISSGKWYTFAIDYNINTGIAIVKLIDGDTVYSYTRDCSATSKGIALSRVKAYCSGFNTGATSSSIVFDNVKFGYSEEEEYPSFDLAAGSSASYEVPFENKRYFVSADIVTKDDAQTTVGIVSGETETTLATVGGNAGSYSVSELIEDTASTAVKFAAGGAVTINNLKIQAVSDFELIESKSTTGSSISLNDGDTVTAKFTNKINKNTFTASTVTMPYIASAPVMTLSFPDDYTVKIDFARELGTHYHIAFTGVEDIYGNTLTDYIEFNTYMPDLYMSDISFTRDGKNLSLTSPGKIEASFTANANNGKSFGVKYFLGLYLNGELTQIDSDTFTVSEETKTYTLDVTVPSDGKYYVAKAFIWNNNLVPYRETSVLKATSDQPIAIVKLDDLRDNHIDKFVDITSWAEEKDIKVSYGVIAHKTFVDASYRDKTIAKAVAMYNNPNVELWYHGYNISFEYDEAKEAQSEDFKLGIDVAAEHGITFTSFCPPQSKYTADTMDLLDNTYKNFTNIMIKDKPLSVAGIDGNYNITVLTDAIDVEENRDVDGDGDNETIVRSTQNLINDWNTAKSAGKDYILLQSHPGSAWIHTVNGEADTTGETNFKAFIDYLIGEGVVFMTPSEYTEYSKNLN